MNITVTFRDKAEGVKRFVGAERVRYEMNAVIITDRYGGEVHYPLDRVHEIEKDAEPRGF